MQPVLLCVNISLALSSFGLLLEEEKKVSSQCSSFFWMVNKEVLKTTHPNPHRLVAVMPDAPILRIKRTHSFIMWYQNKKQHTPPKWAKGFVSSLLKSHKLPTQTPDPWIPVWINCFLLLSSAKLTKYSGEDLVPEEWKKKLALGHRALRTGQLTPSLPGGETQSILWAPREAFVLIKGSSLSPLELSISH